MESGLNLFSYDHNWGELVPASGNEYYNENGDDFQLSASLASKPRNKKKEGYRNPFEIFSDGCPTKTKASNSTC